MAKIITVHPVQHLRPAETATIAPIKATRKNAFILSTCVTCATCAACAGKQSNDHERESFFLSLSEGTDRTSEMRIGVKGSIQDLNTCPPQPYLKSNDFSWLRIAFFDHDKSLSHLTQILNPRSHQYQQVGPSAPQSVLSSIHKSGRPLVRPFVWPSVEALEYMIYGQNFDRRHVVILLGTQLRTIQTQVRRQIARTLRRS